MSDDPRSLLALTADQRRGLWKEIEQIFEDYRRELPFLPVTPTFDDPVQLRARFSAFDFEEPRLPGEAVNFCAQGLTTGQVHTPHPRYFGLFNPAPSAMGVIADALVAAFNPQMAAWSHNPFAAETEQHLIRSFGRKFGYSSTYGTFTCGGAEANLTGLLCALTAHFPRFAEDGVKGLPGQPALYVSEQAHHSFVKAARCCGIGSNAIRQVPVKTDFKIDLIALEEQILRDRDTGYVPFCLMATAGTTATGAIDDLAGAAEIAARQRIWFHVDAAWGGAAAIVSELRDHLLGIDQADSITFDAHKFLSVPMGAGIFLTRHAEILSETFRITTDYMPPAVARDTLDPYSSSIQWSRRFIGLKVFLSLAVAGWKGYAEVIRHQTAMGAYLREQLLRTDWEIVNQTPLPLVCFRSRSGEDLASILEKVLQSGHAWISSVRLPNLALRACITNYGTTEEHVDELVNTLGRARDSGLRLTKTSGSAGTRM